MYWQAMSFICKKIDTPICVSWGCSTLRSLSCRILSLFWCNNAVAKNSWGSCEKWLTKPRTKWNGVDYGSLRRLFSAHNRDRETERVRRIQRNFSILPLGRPKYHSMVWYNWNLTWDCLFTCRNYTLLLVCWNDNRPISIIWLVQLGRMAESRILLLSGSQ